MMNVFSGAILNTIDLNHIDVLFVDIFDTIIFRRCHFFDVIKEWASSLCRAYPALNSDTLFKTRMELQRSIIRKILF